MKRGFLEITGYNVEGEEILNLTDAGRNFAIGAAKGLN
jgi:hypothetical protein